ncbi:hypothetical protein EHF33_16255 (plasmid) [Deinococcus psychrotolerans]|uniref:SD-repeat containing protein B domain-containing protein n=1 Tax=Deinococcus psychrotolerans TaxID=2489213 RepID=A0A3G8YJJ2_9DEIO|nr:hypothetical protein [Deinococcus psychrotolerans]AZI44467.1 hypothetical protein EHF33_16255 [Deinococcus psychrotolerans]
MTAMLAASLSAAQAQSALPVPTPFSLTSPTPRSGVPGQLVTLTFRLEGQGRYDLAVESPPGWVPITPRAQLDLSGQTLFPVTFRIPAQAPAGQVPITVRAQQGGQDVMSAKSNVTVQAKSLVGLSSPAKVEGAAGVFLKIPVDVVNLGNQTDTFDLALENVDSRPQLSARSVTLKAGERTTVQVSLILSGISPDYHYTTYVLATSRSDSAVVARSRSEILFRAGTNRTGGSAANSGPSLLFKVRSEAEVAYQRSDQGDQVDWGYGVQASGSGQLSDSVEAAASSEVGGDQAAALPSTLSAQLELRSETWSAQVTGSSSGVSVGGSVQAGDWTIAPRAQYQALGAAKRYGAGVDVSGPVAGGKFSASASSQAVTLGEQSQRQDSFGARYAVTLSPALDLSVSASAQGTQSSLRRVAPLLPTDPPADASSPVPAAQPAPTGTPTSNYSFGAQAAQILTYRSGNVDFTETYSASLGGLHTFGVSGGLSSAAPLGLRAAATVQLTPKENWYGVSGLAFFDGGGSRSFGASIGGHYQFSSDPTRASQWQASAGVSSPTYRVKAASFGELSLAATLRAALSSDDNKPLATDRSLGLEGGLSTAALQLRASASAQQDYTNTQQQREQLSLGLASSYRLGENEFGAQVGAARVSLDGVPTTTYSGQVSWQRQWSAQLSSALDFSQSWQNNSEGSSARSSAGVSVEGQDVLTPGLSLRASYRLAYDSAKTGPSSSGQPLSQAARVGVSYDLALAVATPAAVVQAFGGLSGSLVSGTLYRDDNLNGVRDPGEAALAGVTVQAGNQTSVTDAQGRYQLQVSGPQTLSFPSGLSAALEPFGAGDSRRLTGTAGSRETRDIGFAPVGNVDVLAYQDLNQNGVYDADEPGLPYASVRLVGPVTRTVQADSRGHARTTLPLGRYTAALDLTGIAGLSAAAPLQADVQVGAAGAGALQLGAVSFMPKAVLSYKNGAAAIFARLDSETAQAGDDVRLNVQLQGADSLSVRAFGQDYPAALSDNRAEITLRVPQHAAPGVYDLVLTASGPSGQKTSSVRLILTPTATTPVGEVTGP